jgi:hypothetical protein
MLALLGGLADVERDLIRTPTAEGRSLAQKARAAHGPTAEIDTGAEGRGPPPTGAGRYACRTRAQLPRGQEHDFAANSVTETRKADHPALQCMDVESWRLPTKAERLADIQKMQELANTIKTRSSKQKRRPSSPNKRSSILVVRRHLSPADLYCYLKARFGNPNGFQTFLRKDDSENWIHWDFDLKSLDEDVYMCGTSREIHFRLSESLTDEDWRDFILRIKADYKRVGKGKSAILKSFEKWVIFTNKFVEVANICADLHSQIVDNIGKCEEPYEPLSSAT